MLNSSFVLFYVEDLAASLKFYKELLGLEPLESSPGFAMFGFQSGMKFAIWSRKAVKPAPVSAAGSCELLFMTKNADELHATHENWRERGLSTEQEPTVMDFGHTFVALDPDGHRLRVLAPADESTHKHA